MKRRRYKPELKRNQTFSLNITSMTDMFTIMLVFLLQTFTTSDVQIDPAQGLRLPASTTEKNPVHGVKISLSLTELKIDSTKISGVKNSEFEASALDPKDTNFIKPLFDYLQKLNANTADKTIGKILFQADQDLPYSTLSKVMYTASMAGFPHLKLVTVVGE